MDESRTEKKLGNKFQVWRAHKDFHKNLSKSYIFTRNCPNQTKWKEILLEPSFYDDAIAKKNLSQSVE